MIRLLALALFLQASLASAQALPRCASAAVLVTVDGGTGSGTMVDPRGFVLTNQHVIAPVMSVGFEGPSLRGGAHIRVLVPNASTLEASRVYEASLVAVDSALDLALLRLEIEATEQPSFEFAELIEGPPVSIGTIVTVLGFPFGNRMLTVLPGTVAGHRERSTGVVDWLAIDAPFNPGNSGGALVDSSCKLVGVPTQVFRGGLNPVNLARPVDDLVRAFLARALLLSRPSVVRASFDAPPASSDTAKVSTSRRRRARRD